MSRLPRLPVTTLLVCAAAVIVAYLAFTTVRYVFHNYQLRSEERAVRREIAGLDRDHDQLVAARDYLKSDEYVEYVARSILGLVRPGETLVIVSGAGSPVPAATPTPVRDPLAPWWKDLLPAVAPAPTPQPAP